MKFEVGDVVMDSWGIGAPEKVTVTSAEKTLVGMRYYVRNGSYDSPYPRSRRDLTLIESQAEVQRRLAKEHKPPRLNADTKVDIVGHKAVIVGNGGKHHHYTKGDVCYVMSHVSSYGYVLMRMGDGFNQVVTRDAFEIFTESPQSLAREAMEMKTPRSEVMRDATRRSEWFDVATKDGRNVFGRPNQALYQMRALSDGHYEVYVDKNNIACISAETAEKYFERYDIDDYATEYPRKKEAKEMSYAGALHGYPPEEDDKVAKAVASRIAELEAELREKEQQYEVARREKVAQEYGIVAERHLWDVVVDVPMRWSPARPKGGNERSTEVVTEGRDMCEAAMAAEAMAKGISEDAHVLSVTYNRILGAIK